MIFSLIISIIAQKLIHFNYRTIPFDSGVRDKQLFLNLCLFCLTLEAFLKDDCVLAAVNKFKQLKF